MTSEIFDALVIEQFQPADKALAVKQNMALPEKIQLEIVSPEKALFSGVVDQVTVHPCSFNG